MSFASQMRAFTNKAEGAVDKTVKSITFALFREVVMRTPVDSGRLKGNWQTTIGAPATSEDSGRTDTTPKWKIAASSDWDILNKAGGVGTVTYLTNNLPYAHRIEFDGWSKVKAPEGMIRVSLARINAIVAKATRDNKV